jgi:hypothetical protein
MLLGVGPQSSLKHELRVYKICFCWSVGAVGICRDELLARPVRQSWVTREAVPVFTAGGLYGLVLSIVVMHIWQRAFGLDSRPRVRQS